MSPKGRWIGHNATEPHTINQGSVLRQLILGGQDGLVNVLGIILGVASATNETRIVLIAGIAGTLAESVSMAAVAYTSSRAIQDHYWKELEREKREIKELPEVERDEIRYLYYKKGFRGKALEEIVDVITSNEKTWLRTMMQEELGLTEAEFVNPINEAVVIGMAALVGSLIPLVPFIFLPVSTAIPTSVLLSAAVLFTAGAVKAKLTVGEWWKSGLEMAGIGMLAAVIGYTVGALLGSRI